MPQLDDAAGVRTFYVDEGSGEPVVVLHGGLEHGGDWAPLAEALTPTRRVLRPDRRGHGRTPDVEGPYTYEAMADETVAFLDQVVGGPADLVGYSDGGTVALLVALDRPDLVRSVVTIGSHVHWRGIVPAMHERLAHPDPDNPRLAPMRDDHAAVSPDGADHWATFYRKVCEMGATGPELATERLRGITARTLIVVGDDDVVDLHHTVELFENVPDSQLAVVPDATHLVLHEHPDELIGLVQRFLAGDDGARIMPMRKAPPAGGGPSTRPASEPPLVTDARGRPRVLAVYHRARPPDP